jgi:hypothetical protein
MQLAQMIADDIFQANGGKCSVTIAFFQGLFLDPATYEFGLSDYPESD